MSHGDVHAPSDLVELEVAAPVAETLQALATPSRLRILGCLAEAPRTVNDLAAAVEMEPSAVSHQLRVLRAARLVVRHRDGRHAEYQLHDDHVAGLLAEAMSHVEHMNRGLAAKPAAIAEVG
jgi:DNA-binding transcriptional ArsR family regulator